MGGEPAGRSSNDRQWTATSNCSSSFSKLEATKKQKGQTKSDHTSIRIAIHQILFLVVIPDTLPVYIIATLPCRRMGKYQLRHVLYNRIHCLSCCFCP